MLHELEKMCLVKDFDKEKAEQILKQIDIDQEFVTSDHGYKTTFLDYAATFANYGMVKLLLENGANPNLLYDNGTENVLWNLQYSEDQTEINDIRLEIVKLLLENGADPHIKVEGEDLYHWATACWQNDMGTQAEYRGRFIDLLEDYGA